MREILFRGKRIDNGEWVKGYILNDGFEGLLIAPSTIYYDYDDLPGIFKECIIAPDTLGQYTGLTDRNGKKIFEGDILNVDADDSLGALQVVVKYGEYEADDEYLFSDRFLGFYIESEHATTKVAPSSIMQIEEEGLYVEVVGNVFDNTELIGGESGA